MYSVEMVYDEIYERARAGQDEWVLSVISKGSVREATTDSQKIVLHERRETLEPNGAEFINSKTVNVLCKLILLS